MCTYLKLGLHLKSALQFSLFKYPCFIYFTSSANMDFKSVNKSGVKSNNIACIGYRLFIIIGLHYVNSIKY